LFSYILKNTISNYIYSIVIVTSAIVLIQIKSQIILVYLGFVVDFLHDIQLGSIKHIMNINAIGTKDTFAGLWRMRLAIDLPIIEIDLIRVVGLKIELAFTDETLEARLVVDITLYGSNALESVHLIATSETSSG
jgi:hypothetical protein